jgi:hypothetical protein
MTDPLPAIDRSKPAVLSVDQLQDTDDGEEWYPFGGEVHIAPEFREQWGAPKAWAVDTATSHVRSEDGGPGRYHVTVTEGDLGETRVLYEAEFAL